MNPVLDIERLGAQGDGIARGERGPVYIPFVLPGERVSAAVTKDRGDLLSVQSASALRVAPACRHFTSCGGCALQHFEQVAYREWKREKVAYALASRGIDAEVAPLVPCPQASRRRLAFAVRKTTAGVLFGFNQALSHRIVPIEVCPIAVSAIQGALADLREMASAIAATQKAFRLTVTATVSGLDLAAEGSGPLSGALRLRASQLVREKGFARLAVDGEVIIEPRRPLVTFGAVAVAPPPGAFLQAVEAAEEKMAALVCGHLAGARNAVDLFAGCGTFALRLAQGAKVHAVESDRASLAALDVAARNAAGLKPVGTEARDLFRRPLRARELDAFGGLVFDPPRAGAEAQSREIANSHVPLVAAVSCNPVTLARDLAILTEGGYRIVHVVPIDQFLWSPHVEVVALLEKKPKRR